MAYYPRPIDTSKKELPDELVPLTEALAQNAHEIWADKRLQEGWKFGPRRDDGRKEHPCLVPYDELPESEKDVDRQMVLRTLKAILSLGYRIEKA